MKTLWKVAFALGGLFGAFPAPAEMTLAAWNAVVNLDLVIEKVDGSEVPGKLLSVGERDVQVVKTRGRVVSVQRSEVAAIRFGVPVEPSAAEVSNEVWSALEKQSVVIEKRDGSEVAGTLVGVEDLAVTVGKASGRAVTVARQDILTVRVRVSGPFEDESPAGASPARKVSSQSGGIPLRFGAGASGTAIHNPDVTYRRADAEYEDTFDTLAAGGAVLFDANYVQVSLGYLYDLGGYYYQVYSGSGRRAVSPITDVRTYLTCAALLKFPIVIGPVAIFPLLGAEYRFNLVFTDSSGNNLKPLITSQERADLNELWFLGGLGLDINIGRFFIRPEALAGLKLPSSTDNDICDYLEASGATDVSLTCWSIVVGLYFGYRF